VLTRRELAVNALGIVAWWSAVEAQQSTKLARVAVLHPSSEHPAFRAFRTALHDLGWIEGQTLLLEYRVSGEAPERVSQAADEIVRSKPDVIVTGVTLGAVTMKRATSSIPIVMAVSLDPVAHGIVKSLARPGGNITGQAIFAPEFSSKRLELLKEALPNATRIAAFWTAATASATEYLRQSEVAGRALGVSVTRIEVRHVNELEAAFQRARGIHADAVVTVQAALFYAAAKRIAELAFKYRMPVLSSESGFAEQGGLMNYGDSIVEAWRRAAAQVDKILRGSHPGNIPIEQPTKFELVINLRTARALGLTIPGSLLLRADQVIE
jgi:putative tryptophan/tyrosine transport system substrate-binding protein